MLGRARSVGSFTSRYRQRGMTLLELMIAGATSIIASAGMILVMANTLGSSSQAIQMTRVTQDMRTAMQIMTRELRRANYNATFMSCYGDTDCLNNLGIASKVGNIGISDNGDSDCLWFWYDRPQSDTEVTLMSEPVAAFRHTTASGVGKLQMTTALTGTPDCEKDANWFDITNPEVINILTLNINDAGSFSETINSVGDIQNIERIELVMTAQLVSQPSSWLGMETSNSQRELREFIKVRNNTVTKPVLIISTPGP